MSAILPLPELHDYFKSLQDNLCYVLETTDGKATFTEDLWTRPEGGGGRTRVMTHGNIFEQGGVNFSHMKGAALPAAATARHPELQGRAFEAMGVSLIMHPRNPYLPTTHFNVRFFVAESEGQQPIWWFGGGFDLTPFYPTREDCIHWHKTAQDACAPFGQEVYPKFKAWADDYFYLKHRDEARGIGGLFFDDLNEWGFDKTFAFVKSVSNHFLPAYLPMIERHKNKPYGERERNFQCYRRSRYVEFNLLYDRGTIFGLQTGGRTESILISMPPCVHWQYQWTPAPGSPEEALYKLFLPRQNWLIPSAIKSEVI